MRRKAWALVNLGEKAELRVTGRNKNAKTAYAISKPA
jgi:hypothetical protein